MQKLATAEAAPDEPIDRHKDIAVATAQSPYGMAKIETTMADIFKATFDELKQKLRPLGLPETWEQRTAGIWMVHVPDGTVLHWGPKRGTYWCLGPSAEELLIAVQSCLEDRAACYKLIVEADESVLPCNDLVAALRKMGCNAMPIPT